MGNILVNHLLYADDILLISPSAAGLRKLLGDCEDYGYCHDIIFNPKKSAIMICRNSNAKLASYEFQMLNEKIKEKHEVKHLGQILTNKLTDDKDMLRQYNWITGIYLKINSRKIAILCVYIPCLCNIHDAKYKE